MVYAGCFLRQFNIPIVCFELFLLVHIIYRFQKHSTGKNLEVVKKIWKTDALMLSTVVVSAKSNWRFGQYSKKSSGNTILFVGKLLFNFFLNLLNHSLISSHSSVKQLYILSLILWQHLTVKNRKSQRPLSAVRHLKSLE